ncbi:hypothetical protein ACFQ9Z_37885 [Streptomyces sp. NPDC056580]|uniref:hypothetical protein n=1 Tax=Streptomyces sp. NPDC056580 TaxID=3345872 RepID=UPI00368912B7
MAKLVFADYLQIAALSVGTTAIVVILWRFVSRVIRITVDPATDDPARQHPAQRRYPLPRRIRQLTTTHHKINYQTGPSALPADAHTRLGLDEVQALLLAAWETAAETLPGAVTDPARMQWAAPPTTELRLSAEGPHDQRSPGLGALIDLDALGPGDGSVRPEMAITITRSPTMQRQERQKLLRRALVHMARHFGYVWAEEEAL